MNNINFSKPYLINLNEDPILTSKANQQLDLP